MKKHMILSLIIIALVIALPVISIAAGPTRAFGGRIISKTIPTVQCTLPSLNVVMTNSGVSSIPFYTTNFFRPTQVGQWILGRADLIPEFSNCRINLGEVQVPIPVRDTRNYSTSASRLGF